MRYRWAYQARWDRHNPPLPCTDRCLRSLPLLLPDVTSLSELRWRYGSFPWFTAVPFTHKCLQSAEPRHSCPRIPATRRLLEFAGPKTATPVLGSATARTSATVRRAQPESVCHVGLCVNGAASAAGAASRPFRSSRESCCCEPDSSHPLRLHVEKKTPETQLRSRRRPSSP